MSVQLIRWRPVGGRKSGPKKRRNGARGPIRVALYGSRRARVYSSTRTISDVDPSILTATEFAVLSSVSRLILP